MVKNINQKPVFYSSSTVLIQLQFLITGSQSLATIKVGMLAGETTCVSGTTFTNLNFSTWPDKPLFHLAVNFLQVSYWKRSWSIDCVADVAAFNADATQHLFLGKDIINDTELTNSKRTRTPLLKNKLYLISKSKVPTDKM